MTKCILSNQDFNFAESIRTAPIIISPEDKSTLYASLGQSMKIECEVLVSGRPLHVTLLQVKKAGSNNGSGTVVFRKLNITLQITESARGSRITKKAVFQFDSFSKNDFGEYTCMAGNPVGFAARSFTIKKKPLTRTAVKKRQGTFQLFHDFNICEFLKVLKK